MWEDRLLLLLVTLAAGLLVPTSATTGADEVASVVEVTVAAGLVLTAAAGAEVVGTVVTSFKSLK